MKFLFAAILLVLPAADARVETDYEAVESQDTRQVFYQPQPYSYSYNVVDEESNNDFLHSENTDGKVTTGSYRVSLPDGRTQFVTYKADENGYVANVEYEGEAHHPDGYIAPPSPSIQSQAAVAYLAAASSSNTIREASAVKESDAPAAKESATSTTKTRDELAHKKTIASSTKESTSQSVKETSTPATSPPTTTSYPTPAPPSYQTVAPAVYQDTVPPAYNPPSPPTYSPPSPPAYSYLPAYNPSASPAPYQASASPANQSFAYKTSVHRSPSAYRGPSAPGYRPAPSGYGFTPIGPTPLAYRG